MSLWTELVTENPMLIEIHRFRRKFFSFSGSTAVNGIVLGLAIVGYAGLVLTVFSAKGSFSPIAIVLFQTGLLTFIVPSAMYSAIAGEREKRTWDVLIAAPITPAQIIMGKFIGGACMTLFLVALIAFPTLLCAFQYREVRWLDLLLSEIDSITYALLLVAVTLFFSARARRGFMALGTTLGALAVAIVILPLLSGAMGGTDSFDLINTMNPFISESRLLDSSTPGMMEHQFLSPVTWSINQTIGYVLLTLIFIPWAVKTLMFVENDVKFIPRKQDA